MSAQVTCVAGVLLDLDGTLIESEHLHFESTAAVLARRGFTLTAEQYRKYEGWAERDCWASLNSVFGSDLDPDTAVAERSELFCDLAQSRGIEPLPGARKLLSWASAQGLPLAVASALPRSQIDAVLDAAGFDVFFAVRISGHEDVPPGRGKPAPDVYLTAAAQLGVDPCDCAAIEDSPIGIASARSAHCYVIAVRNPSFQMSETAGADAHCNSLGAALNVLKRLCQ